MVTTFARTLEQIYDVLLSWFSAALSLASSMASLTMSTPKTEWQKGAKLMPMVPVAGGRGTGACSHGLAEHSW